MSEQQGNRKTGAITWFPLALAFLAMYAPSVYDLIVRARDNEGPSHGPVILLAAGWLIHSRWARMELLPIEPAYISGFLSLAIGCGLYVLGRSQDIPAIELGSIICVFCGAVLVERGVQPLRTLWFGVFFMIFAIPLPGSVVDALTQPMKIAVSAGADEILYLLGLPVYRQGVMLQVGQYQMLVADACAGLQTVFILEAMGILYLNVVKYQGTARNLLLSLLIVPISYLANTVRVVALCLITYKWGDEAGQGFLHQFAGLFLFAAALALIVFADGVLRFSTTRGPGALRAGGHAP